MPAPTRATTGPLVAPGVLADIVRDYAEAQRQASAERGTSRLDEAGHLVLLHRDAATLAAMAGGDE